MTRFARAKGSKASNERLPEHATPWSQMKEDLLNKKNEIEESKKRKEANNKRNANYKAFLEEKEQEHANNIEWAKFSEVPSVTNKSNKSKSLGKNFKHEKSEEDEDFAELKAKLDKVLDGKNAHNGHNSDSESPPEEKSAKEQPHLQVVKVKKPKKKLLRIVVAQEELHQNKKEVTQKDSKQLEDKVDKKKPKKQKNKRKNEGPDISEECNKKAKKVKENENIETSSKNENTAPELTDEEKELKRKEKLKKRYQKRLEKKKQRKLEARLKRESQFGINGIIVKNNQTTSKQLNKKSKNEVKVVKKAEEDLTEEELKKLQKKKEKRLRQLERKKKLKQYRIENEQAAKQSEQGDNQHRNGDVNKTVDNSTTKDHNLGNTFIKKNNDHTLKPKKPAKIRDKTEHQPKKLRPHAMFINGKTVEIDYIEGFPVRKEDAERLKKLRKEMIAKGLPRSEINIALKLERRRAEKAFAREKKNVCFNCRKSGHNLSECPELGKNQIADSAGTGICFKCGSTEHTHFECKVVKGMEYKFAQCFVCNEQGHIARQCPDNARGLYPKGGACKVCGDVTHLKKDCPKYQAQQEQLQSNIHLNTLDDQNPDILDSKDQSGNLSGINKKPNKVIRF